MFAEVTDTGCGIPLKDQDNIFEPFFTTKAPDRGTGLGLAITRSIVTDLGGDVRVESTVDEGTRFVVRFPIGRAETKRPPSMTTKVPGKRGRILVVDDEEWIRTTIASMLDQEHDVVAVGLGREAKDLLGKDTNFDLVLCDLMMPDVSGIDLHAWLSEHQPRLAQKLVFITGGVFTPRTQEYLGRVSNLRVEKPFDTAGLKKLVNELVIAARG